MSHVAVFWWMLCLMPVLLVFGVVVGRMSVYIHFWQELKGKKRPSLRVNGNDFFIVTEREYERLRDLDWIEYHEQ